MRFHMLQKMQSLVIIPAMCCVLSDWRTFYILKRLPTLPYIIHTFSTQ